MKKIISSIFACVIVLCALTLSLHAADTPGKIHHFTIIAPPTGKVGEAMDITVEAKDKDDKIITSYKGSVYFQSDTDFGATIPAQGRSVSFKESDNGSLKLSKAVIFKRVGNQTLSVTEAVADAVGSISIRIEDAIGSTATGTVESISITTPEKGSTIPGDTVTVSGKTRKNSKITLKLNGVDVGGNLTSDENGIFTKTLTSISQSTNIISASVLDGNNTVIGSTESQFATTIQAPIYYSISILPGLEVSTSTSITLTIDAEPGLSDVSAFIDGTLFSTKEQSPGKYILTTQSPSKEGVFAIGLTLKNILGQTTTKTAAASLTTKTPETPKSVFKNVKITTEGGRVNINFMVENMPSTLSKFKIAYGESPENMTNEVTTSSLEKIRKEDGSYNWYIDKLPVRSYSFKIFGMSADGSLIGSLSSEVLSATIGQKSCSIGDIGAISLSTTADKTVLSWAPLSGAISYNIYRLTAAKEYELIQNIKENTYTIFLSSGAVAYQDFAIKALCDATTESKTPAIASRIQTGPGALTVLVVISALLSIFFVRKRIYRRGL